MESNICKQCEVGTHNRFFCGDECKARWVYQKYVGEQLGAYEIGRMLGCDPKTVYQWLRNNNIPTRPRGTGHERNPAFCFWESGEKNPFQGKRHSPESIAKMSESSKGPSPWLCGEVNHWYGKKGSKSPTWKGGITPERQAFCGTLEWKAVSKAVWQRDSSTCQLCHKHKVEYQKLRFDVHHIISFEDSKDLRAELSNLVLLCHSCHMWVHSKNNSEKVFIGEVQP